MLARLRTPLDDLEHLLDRALEVVVDDDVIGEGATDRLLLLRLAAPAARPSAPGRRDRAAGAPARRARAAARRSARRPGAAPSPGARRRPRSRARCRARASGRASGCRSSCRGSRSTRGSRRRRSAPRTRRGWRTRRRRRARPGAARGWSTTGSARAADRAGRAHATIVPLPTPPGPETMKICGGRGPAWRLQRPHLPSWSSSDAFCCCPRPCTRRLSAMPMSSMILRALTLPTPGSDSSSETTLSLPTVESPLVERLGERQRTHLQLGLQLGASGASLGRLGERSGTLFGGERRGCCHGPTLAIHHSRCAASS